MHAKLVHLGPDQFERFVNQSGDVVYQTDAAGRITYMSAASEALLGHPPGTLIGTHYLFLVAPAVRNEAFRIYGEQVRRKTPTSYHEFPAVTGDGRTVNLGQHVQLLMEEGAVRGFHAVAHDITGRRRAEADRSNRDARIDALRRIAERGALTEDALAELLSKSTELLGMDAGIVARRSGRDLVVVASVPNDAGCEAGMRLALNESLCGVGAKAATSSGDGPVVDRESPFDQPYACYISVPVSWDGTRAGTLTYTGGATRPDGISQADLDFAGLVAGWIGAAFGAASTRESAALDTRRWEHLLTVVDEGVIECTERGVITQVNEAAAKLLGQPAASLSGQDIRLSIPSLLDQAKEGPQLLDWVRPDASTAQLQVHATRVGHRLVCVVRDPEAQKRVSRQRKGQEAVLRSFFDAAPVLMGIVELDSGRLSHRSASPSAIAFFNLMQHQRLATTSGAVADELPGAARWLHACTRSMSRNEPVSFETGYRERRLHVTVNRIDSGADTPYRFTYTVDDITDRALEADHLARRRAEFEAIFQSMPEAVVFADAQRRIVAVNPAFSSMFGHPAETVDGQPTECLFAEPDAAAHRRHDPLDSTPAELWFERADGTRFLGEAIGAHVRGEDGASIGFLEIIRDITREKEAEEHIRFQAGILSQVRDAVVVLDHEMRVTYWNGAAERLTGFTEKEAVNRPVLRVARFRWMSDGQEEESIRQLLNEGTWTGRLRLKTRDNQPRVIEAVVGLLRDATGDASGVVVGARDITATVELEEQLRRQARSDSLTDLPNREVLHEALDRAIARVEDEGRSFALMIVDLDRFKLVNDSLGHAAGDHLLRLVSQRISGVLGPNDLLARIGGDEFAVLLDGLSDISDVQEVAKRIRRILAEPFDLAGRPHACTASVGIVLGDRGHADRASLLRDADTAMYEAKRRGSGHYVLFTQAMHDRVARRFRLESDLGFAVSRNELRVYYQPIVTLKTGEVAGFEALVRWHHAELGLLNPDEFLGVAAECGRIQEIDTWVHETASRQMVEWKAKFGLRFMTVNCSSDTVLSNRFERHNARVLAETGLDPSSLAIEITEHLLIEDVQEAARRLAQLKESGVSICVDDFGTGYSSLNLLHTLPIDTVKIDRSLIADIVESERGHSIVKTIAELAHGLGMSLVAEGIETEEQLKRVRALGYEYGQGYLFSRPVPFDRAEAFLAERIERRAPRKDRDPVAPARTRTTGARRKRTK